MTNFRSHFLRSAMVLIAVLSVALFSYLNALSYSNRQAAVRETLASRDAMVETLSLLKDAETGGRGFLLTGDEQFLEPYQKAVPRVQSALATLARLSAGDTAQQGGTIRVTDLAHQKLNHVALIISLRRQGKPISEIGPLLGRGKALMDAVRVEIGQMMARADLLLQERERRTRVATRRLQVLLAVGFMGALALTLSGLLSARRNATRMQQVNMQLSTDLAARKQAELALRDQTRLLESVLEGIGDGVVVLDRDRKFTIVNPAATRFLPWAPGDASPLDWSTNGHAFLPDGKTVFPSKDGPLTRAVDGHASDDVGMVLRLRSGELRSYSVTTRPITADGVTAAAVAVFRDTTELQRAERDLHDSEQRYRVLAEASFEAVAISQEGIILDANAHFSEWLGYEPHEVVGMPGGSFFAPEDRELIGKYAEADSSSYEANMVRRDGTSFPVEIRGRMAIFRNQKLRIAAIRDVTERKQQEAQLLEKSEMLRALSQRDELTGLYNRRGFMELAEQQLKLALLKQQSFTVFFADLNGMKVINDELGHDMGDHAIRAAAEILSQVFSTTNIVARLGGDEFAIFACELNESGIETVRLALDNAVDALNARSTTRYRLSLSTGVATSSPQYPRDLFGLMQAADSDMYNVKRARRRYASQRVLSS
jgi:diguanylate cyclase (GGDEF)-like protein/PAS domain S-box-containing protein